LWAQGKWLKVPDLTGVKVADVQFEKKKMKKMYDVLLGGFKNLFFDPLAQVGIMSGYNQVLVEKTNFFHDDIKNDEFNTSDAIIPEILKTEDTLTIVSPYFAWVKKYKRAFDELIKKRPLVKIKIIVPAIDKTDSPASSAAFEMQARRMSQIPNYELRLHQGPDLLHAKMILRDNKVLGVMSDNMDFFSTFVNYESGFFFDSPELASQAKDYIKVIEAETKPWSRQKLTTGQYCGGLLVKTLSENW
jgi:phosphatidylserine/phosphatidylglycerophosphate/cardiolipin synthase-like enzyme